MRGQQTWIDIEEKVGEIEREKEDTEAVSQTDF